MEGLLGLQERDFLKRKKGKKREIFFNQAFSSTKTWQAAGLLFLFDDHRGADDGQWDHGSLQW